MDGFFTSQNSIVDDMKVGTMLRYYAHAQDDDSDKESFVLSPASQATTGFPSPISQSTFRETIASDGSTGNLHEASFMSESGDCKLASSEDEPLPVDKAVIECKPSLLLATAPDKNQHVQVLATTPINRQHHFVDLSFLLQRDDSPHHDQQRVTPGAELQRRNSPNQEFLSEEPSNQEFLPEEPARSSLKSGLGHFALSLEQSLNGNSDVRCIGSARGDTSSAGCQDACSESILGEVVSKRPKRANKASKLRRDRYKALVELSKKNIEEDPNVELETLLGDLPSFVTSDDKLCAKLAARLQQHRRLIQQNQSVLLMDCDSARSFVPGPQSVN